MGVFHLSTADVRGNEFNTEYPHRVAIKDPNDLIEAVKRDHVAGEMRGGSRGSGRFVSADCIMVDLDNAHSEDPDFWKSLKDLEEAFPDVEIYVVQSRNYMKQKKKISSSGETTFYEPREKWHLYFRLSRTITDEQEYQKIIFQTIGLFPYLDCSASDTSRFFFGVPAPHVEVIQGEMTIDQYLDSFTAEAMRKTIAQNIDDFVSTSDSDAKEAQKTVNKLRSFLNITPTQEEANSTINELLAVSDIEDQKKSIQWLESWAEKYGLSLGARYQIKTEKHKDGIAICVTCPWESEHSMTGSENESVIIVDLGGKLSYLCRHGHCTARTWKDFRAKIEQTWKDAHPEESVELISLDTVEEREPEFLIKGWFPKKSTILLGAEGGSGKTTLWCHLAAKISSGKTCIFDSGFSDREPSRVLFFSSEDSADTVLKKKIRQAGGDMSNIFTLDLSHERFNDVVFENGGLLEDLIKRYRPVLCIMDPIQQYIPASVRMAERNAMRRCLAPLKRLAELYDVTFVLICHTNKRDGSYGRKRLADSADLWDFARSVLMVGETDREGIRYISNEKNNYCKAQSTILFRITDDGIQYEGTTSKRDKDFVALEMQSKGQPSIQRQDAERFIIDLLERNEGRMEVGAISEAAKSADISETALRNAKGALLKAGTLRRICESQGKGKGSKWFLEQVNISALELPDNTEKLDFDSLL